MIFAPVLAINTVPLRSIYSLGLGVISTFTPPMSSFRENTVCGSGLGIEISASRNFAGGLLNSLFILEGGKKGVSTPCWAPVQVEPRFWSPPVLDLGEDAKVSLQVA